MSEFESVEEQDDVFTEASVAKRGQGRPKIIRTGRPGRPRKEYNTLNLIQASEIKVPETVKEALASEHSQCWWDAMQEEYQALIDNGTWEITDLPQGQKSVGCKWVFALKRGKDGLIERFKARLVAKGYAQEYGVNYTETFSPVVRYETIRMLIALAAQYELHLHQMDVSTAYLNSELSDDVYMSQPPCFVIQRKSLS